MIEVPSHRQPNSLAHIPSAESLADGARAADSMPLLYRIQVQAFLPLVCPTLMRLQIIGEENVPRRGAVILAANHLDNWDPYVCGLSLRHRAVHHFARANGMASRGLGTYWRLMGTIPADSEGLKAALRILRSGGAVGIYPEGRISPALNTAGQGVAMLALRSGAPVVPVALWGTETVHPYRVLKRPSVTIRYGPPRVLSRGRGGSMQALSDELMREIACMLPPRYRGVYAGDVDGQMAVGSLVDGM